MKSVAILALAATVSATGWSDASAYSCPSNTDETCNTEQSSGGFGSWDGLEVGSSVTTFGGFSFGNTECVEAGSFQKRALGGRFAPRTSSKAIGGSCSSDKSKSINFGCGSSGSSSGSSSGGSSSSQEISSFSVDSFSIYTEFDCDIEFQYDMPDGSSCKHRSSCSSQGTSVKNSQCGGATNVTVVYPTGQTGNNIPPASTTCSVNIPTVSFACGSASSTVIASTSATAQSQTKTIPAVGSTVTPSGYSPSGIVPSGSQAQPTPSNAGSTTYSASTIETATASIATPSVESSLTSNSPVTSTAGTATAGTYTPVIETPSASVETPSASVETPSASVATPVTSAESSVTSNSPVTESAPPAGTTNYDITSTQVTTYVGTSTVYSTSYSTITSCAPEVTNCPIKSGETAVTTVVVPAYTTICPITETQTAVYSSGATTPYATGVVSSTTPATPEESTSSNSPVQGTGSAAVGTTTLAAPATSVVTAVTTETVVVCPAVLPACISTWNCK